MTFKAPGRTQHIMRKVLIVVPCSDRKFGFTPSNLKAASLDCGSVNQVAEEWLDRIKDAVPTSKAGEMYAGRSFSELRKARTIVSAELIVISAGLGVVRSTDRIPNYALTVSRGSEDSISCKIAINDFVPDIWWEALKSRNLRQFSLQRKVDEVGADLILFGLSKNYARMIRKELTELSQETIKKCRLFGVGLQDYLPGQLTQNLLEYDQRLNGPDSFAVGTMTDLVARSIHDFCDNLDKNKQLGLDLEADKSFVQDRMCDLRYPLIPKRKAMSDDEVIQFILDNLKHTQGKTADTLKLLRKSGFACEQSRFASLFRNAKNRTQLQGEFKL